MHSQHPILYLSTSIFLFLVITALSHKANPMHRLVQKVQHSMHATLSFSIDFIDSDAIIDNHFLQMEQSLLNSLNDSYLYETTGSFKQRSPLASSKQLSSMETNSSLPTSSGTKKEPTNPSALHHYTSNLYTNLTVPTGPTRDSTTFSPIHKSPSYSAVNDPSHPAALSTHSAGDSEDLLQSSFSSSSKRTLEAPDYIPIYPQASLKRPLGSSSTPDTTRTTTTPPSAPHLPYLNGTMNSIMKSNLVENLKNSETILSRYQDRSDKDVHPSAFNPYPDPHSITSSWKGPTYESKSTNDNSSTPKRLKYGPDTNPFGTPPSDSKRQSINSVVFPSKDNSKDGSL